MLNATLAPNIDQLAQLEWVEYCVFGAILSLSAAVSLYHGVKERATANAYILGDRNINVFPATMSLIASHVSGVTVVGVPAEVYMYGTQYLAVLISDVIVAVVNICFFIPVFYNLQITSLFEYLELRFNHKVRVLGSTIFSLYLIFYIPVVIYVPALVLNQVTGLPVHIVAPAVSAVCIFYTTFGGLKGVAWTVALQSVFTAVSVAVVIILGCLKVGGVGEVFSRSKSAHRLELFNFDPDPLARNTFWTITLGTTINWISTICFHPGVVQKYLSVPSREKAFRVMTYSALGIAVIKCVTVFLGLLMFAYYISCDPLAAGVVHNPGQLLPLFVSRLAGYHFRGLTGLFIAGVFTATLSTMSASLNAVAGTVYTDFVQPLSSTDKHATLWLKLIVVVIGSICVSLVFFVENLGGVLQVAVSLGGVAYGPLLTLFILGLLSPWTNAKGALAGAVSSLVTSLWIVIGSQLNVAEEKIRFPGKVTSTSGCHFNFTVNPQYTSDYIGPGSVVEFDPDVPQVFRISYMYYAVVGTTAGLVVAALTTMVSHQDLSLVDPNLLVTGVRRFLPEKQKVVNKKTEETKC
ncbi:sodium-coupled monocarboxylate transporter 2-like [Macrosteles quadrilineatus]|uniref:sodium-coupled monocarboxylate transporter 2-like n=1 Tax=Macrosteles quadrilineatus TaxID=74068 RepID=UPI0023E2935B|nr:sodium-coupled monocarboxylate transporter 2-like [Macrosteles quadrilineatus]